MVAVVGAFAASGWVSISEMKLLEDDVTPVKATEDG
jgi:hypothetical protein